MALLSSMRHLSRGVPAALVLSLSVATAQQVSAPDTHPIPRIVEQNGRHALLVDGAPYLILGAQVHNSSAWPALLPKIWPAMEFLHVNTVEIPVYWEQIEPRPNRFDFSLVDTLVRQARVHDVRLVLLWFATWKNGSAHYRPEWMKLQPERFPNVVGRDGQAVDSPSPYAEEALQLDARAFAALMSHLRQTDPQRTVIMVQVENETGSWGTVRDFSRAAQQRFNSAVPLEMRRLVTTTVPADANWTAVFGDDADEFFNAYSVAHYVQQVAAAGKAAYPLPLYVNAQLRDPFQAGRAPGYESGGPTWNVLHIWKAAAPAVDLIGPDIYLSGSARVLKTMELYARPDNTLFIPEIGNSADNARYVFAALGLGAIGYAPFGVDDTRADADSLLASTRRRAVVAPLAASYAAIGPMMRPMAQWVFEGRVHAVVEREEKSEPVIALGGWNATVKFGVDPRGNPQGNAQPTGRVLVAQLAPNEFIVSGFSANVAFRPAGDTIARAWQFLKVEEGQYVGGTFVPVRIWNGDETDWGLNFGTVPQVLHVTLALR